MYPHKTSVATVPETTPWVNTFNGLQAPGGVVSLPKTASSIFCAAPLFVANDFRAGGTPNSFVNGVPVKGARPFEGFKKVVDEELARAKGEKVPEGRGGR